MAPPPYSAGVHFGKGVAQRAESESCSGWDCLSDATQAGILLVAVSSVAVLGYLYWRFKIKPNRQHGGNNGARTSTHGQWEVTRRSPNTLSITLYREPRPPSNEEAGTTDSRAPARARRKKGNNKSTQTEENQLDQTTEQAGIACVPQIHLLPPPPVLPPPPPAPIFWTAATPSAIPPPPPFGHPVPWPPAPPPVTQYAVPIGSGPATAPYPPDVPPPYFNHAASRNFERYGPKQRNDETTRPAWTPQPNPWSRPPRVNQERMRQAAPLARDQRQRRRWFSWGGQPRVPGHARTLSNSSSFTIARIRSPSPPPRPDSPKTDGRARGHTRESPSKRARQSSVNHHRAEDHARTPRQNQPPVRKQHSHRCGSSASQSEISYSSSYINSSDEAVCNPIGLPEPRHKANQQPSRERRSCRDDRGPAPRRAPSDSISLSPLPRQRSLSARPRFRRVEPSPDIQFPTPERRRAQVSFERSSTGNPGRTFTPPPPPPPRDSSARRPSRTRRAPSGSRRRSQARRQREPTPSLFEVFRLIRHALRDD
ncbi:uncharacterized protein B0T15DRAFT_308280 [Chaetomium strumarium]|uniref:Uncharacterized protein n=1 Tax=Chaetomium strumarium TaxID=1170767 RepID=A0AAJ0GM65_9PEZI|nr:hypothetical protein B0T15DRAFT_308280 [Chaetomium strumarium]